MMKNLRGVLYAVVAAVAGAIVGTVVTLLAVRVILPSPKESNTSSPEGVEFLVEELSQLRTQAGELEAKAAEDENAKVEVGQLNERLSEMESRLGQFSAEISHKDMIVETGTRLVTHGLSLTSVIITVMTVFFSVFVAILGFVSFARFDIVQAELGRRKDELGDLLVTIESEGEKTRATRRFVQRVAEQFFSGALLEVVSSLGQGGLLDPDADKALRNKLLEFDDRLSLWHSDLSKVEAGVRNLYNRGTQQALPDLFRLLEDSGTPRDLKTLTSGAVVAILGRR